MKNLRMKSPGMIFLGILVGIMIVSTSCNTNEQASGSSKKAPKASIHEAAFLGNAEALKAHIEAKTDLNQKDDYGSAALTIAAIFNKPEIAKLLIDAGADINVKSGDGSTPLHSAAFFCRTEIVEMLLEKRADVTIRNNYGSTALESIASPFAEMKAIYDQVSRDLGPLGLKLDYSHIEKTRPVIVEMIQAASN